VWDTLLGEEPAAAPEAGAPGAPDAGTFAPFVGRYRADFGILRGATLEVLVNADGALALDVPGQMVYALKPPDADGRRVFALTNTIAVSFREMVDERAQVLVLHQGGLDLEAPREGFEYPVEIPLEELEPLLGRYAWPEHDEVLEVVLRNNHLAVDIPSQGIAFELRPPDADGVRVARAADRIRFAFKTEDGRVTAMVFRDTGYEADCPRLDPAAPLPTPAEVHALRRTDERAAAFEAAGGIRVRSRAWAAQSGVEGTETVCVDGWERASTAFDFGRYGWIKSALLGEDGFEVSSFEPSEELGPERLRQARHGHPAVQLADWRRAFPEERVARRGELDGRPTLELQLQDGDLPPAVVDLDPETGDVLRWREPHRHPRRGPAAGDDPLLRLQGRGRVARAVPPRDREPRERAHGVRRRVLRDRGRAAGGGLRAAREVGASRPRCRAG
jgi:hypothetical protein